MSFFYIFKKMWKIKINKTKKNKIVRMKVNKITKINEI